MSAPAAGQKPKLLLIDNYDSFTYNLVQAFMVLGADVQVYRNDEISVEGAVALRNWGAVPPPIVLRRQFGGVNNTFGSGPCTSRRTSEKQDNPFAQVGSYATNCLGKNRQRSCPLKFCLSNCAVDAPHSKTGWRDSISHLSTA